MSAAATVRQVGTLRDALHRSQAGASDLTKSFFAGGFLDAAAVIALVNGVEAATIATVSDAGIPHAACVIAACHDEVIHFTVTPGSVLARNIDHQPRIGFSVMNREHSVMGQGDASLVGRSLTAPQLLESLDRASSSGQFTPRGWDGLVYRIVPRRIVAG